jgi:WD40-like Beta Propeller Repeat
MLLGMVHKLWLAGPFTAAAAIVAIACVGDDPAVNTTPDAQSGVDAAGPDAAEELDAGQDAKPSGPCDVNAPWQTPVALKSASSPDNEQRPSLSADELTIYFSSRRLTPDNDAGVSRVYFATRTDKETDSFTAATLLSADINRPGYDTVGSALSNDRRRLYFAAKTDATPDVIYEAERAGGLSGNSWAGATVKPIGDQDAGWTEFSPFLANDGTLYFARTGAPTNYDLFRADPDGANGFKKAVPIAELASAQDDSDPVLSPDGLTIYFSSSRAGSLDTDIWAATRAPAAAGFGPPARVSELSSPARDVPAWISPDGCRMYIISTRPGGPGALDIFVASRP